MEILVAILRDCQKKIKITIMKINGMRLNLLRLLQLFKLKHIVLFKHQWGQYVQLVDRRMYQKYH